MQTNDKSSRTIKQINKLRQTENIVKNKEIKQMYDDKITAVNCIPSSINFHHQTITGSVSRKNVRIDASI